MNETYHAFSSIREVLATIVDDNVLCHTNLPLFTTTWLWAIIVFATSLFIYYGFVKPIEICGDLTTLGFGYLKDGSYRSAEHRKLSKRELVRDINRKRAIGDLPPVYPNGWFALIESSDVRVEQVKHVMALGENFAVFRDSKGKIHIVDAYCPHLGANMAIGGQVRGDCLECPFHKWQFSSKDGSCVHVPYSSSCPSTARVKVWPSTEANEFIFVWYHAEGEEPTWHIEQNKQIASGQWRYHGRTDLIVGCHIQEIPENGADVGHLNALHGPSLICGMDIRNISKSFLNWVLSHGWTASWEQSAKEPHKGLLSLCSEARIGQKFVINRLEATIEQIGPGYVELLLHASWGPMLLCMTVTPMEPLRQRVVQRIFSSPMTGLFTRFVLYIETVMFARDAMVWNHKKYISKPVLVKEDSLIVRHRRWFHQFYSENSPRFQFQKDTLDW